MLLHSATSQGASTTQPEKERINSMDVHQHHTGGAVPVHRKRWMLSVPSEQTDAGGNVMAAASRVKLCHSTQLDNLKKSSFL